MIRVQSTCCFNTPLRLLKSDLDIELIDPRRSTECVGEPAVANSWWELLGPIPESGLTKLDFRLRCVSARLTP